MKDIHKPFLQKLIECCNPNKNKKHRKVNETPLRSLLKTMGFRIVEILVDTLLLQLISQDVGKNLIIAIMIELFCWLLGFIWERLWNRTDFGRIIIAKCPKCEKEMEVAECEKPTKKRKLQKPR